LENYRASGSSVGVIVEGFQRQLSMFKSPSGRLNQTRFGKKFLLRDFFGQVLNQINPSFIRASLLSKEYFISPRFFLLEFKITSNLVEYFRGCIHV
jgi:hypothetical protein